MNVGDQCPTCGAEVFNYNSVAVGCKRGHRYERETGYPLSVAREPGEAPVAYVAPAPVGDPAPAARQSRAALVSGAAIGGGLVALADLITRVF